MKNPRACRAAIYRRVFKRGATGAAPGLGCFSRHGAIHVLFLALGMAGCGVPATPLPDSNNASGNADDDPGPASEFVFEAETQDPTLADLESHAERLLVRTLAGASEADLDDMAAAAGVTLEERIPELDAAIFAMAADRLSAAAEALSADARIESVGKDYYYEQVRTTNDPQAGEQTHLTQMGLAEAWDVTRGDPSILIAVLDTGVRPDHPDLVDRLVEGYNEAEGNANYDDVYGHGTAVAGAAAATGDNNMGVVGVAWQCRVLPIRVSRKDGRASSATIANGILRAMRSGAQVINISFGPLQTDKLVLAAAERARNNGVSVFIAAGNDGKMKSDKRIEAAQFIGAVGSDNTLAKFSTKGDFVDFVAPGVAIVTTDFEGSYSAFNGTSFSCPLAAGTAALVFSVNSAFRPVTVAEILRASALDLGKSGRDSEYGNGLIQAGAAVRLAVVTAEPGDELAPTVSIASPVEGATAKGRLAVAVEASDRNGVADVVLSLDGEPTATDTTSPYSFTVDLTKVASGTHTLSAVAADPSGNASETGMVSIVVGGEIDDTTPPEIAIIKPTEGAVVVGTVEIAVLATDNAGLASIEWRVDGKALKSKNVSGVRVEASQFWNSSKAPKGAHTLEVVAKDAAGLSRSATVRVAR